MKRLPLSSLRPGQRGVLTGLSVQGTMRTRLEDLGFVEGAGVRCLGVSPLGDPKAYGLGATTVALRARDAGEIFVRLVREGGAPDGTATAHDRRARGKSKRRKIDTV